MSEKKESKSSNEEDKEGREIAFVEPEEDVSEYADFTEWTDIDDDLSPSSPRSNSSSRSKKSPKRKKKKKKISSPSNTDVSLSYEDATVPTERSSAGSTEYDDFALLRSPSSTASKRSIGSKSSRKKKHRKQQPDGFPYEDATVPTERSSAGSTEYDDFALRSPSSTASKRSIGSKSSRKKKHRKQQPDGFPYEDATVPTERSSAGSTEYDDFALRSPSSTASKRSIGSKSSRKKKHRKQQPDGFHGKDVDMEAVKDESRRKRSLPNLDEMDDVDENEDAAGDDVENNDNIRSCDDNNDKSAIGTTVSSWTVKTSKSIRAFLNDDPSEMTYQRRLALHLMKKKWYNPQYDPKDDDEETDSDDDTTSTTTFRYPKPSLAKAWAYFEHNTLQRYVVEEDDEEDDGDNGGDVGDLPRRGLKRPEVSQGRGKSQRFFNSFLSRRNSSFIVDQPHAPSEKTKLFDPIGTPHSELGKFGIGVALYFSSLLAVALLTFIAGIASVYSMYYFASDEYDSSERASDLPLLLRGSAVCTDTSWVPCPTCDCSVENNPERFEAHKEWEAERCVMIPTTDGFNLTNVTSTTHTTSGAFLTFALKNNCDGAVWDAAAPNYSAILIIYFGIMAIGCYLNRALVHFNEAEQVSQDYSIEIKNPPPDANDPEEWRTFFKENCDGAQVAVCTCSIDNDLLVQALLERRETYLKIRSSLPIGHQMDVLSLAHAAAEYDKERSIVKRLLALARISPCLPEYFAHLVVLNAKIQALAQLDYQTTRVFVTFETEADRRHVLKNLTVGSAYAKKNDPSKLSDKKYMFRGKHVLNVGEAIPPSAVHWRSLNVGTMRKIRQRVVSICLMGVVIYLAFLVIRSVNFVSTAGTALTISAFNKICPSIAKAVSSFEQHNNEESRQKFLYFKIAAFRWINTVVAISLITPFTSYLEDGHGLIPQVYAVFFSEIITLSIVQLCDFGGHFQRHFLAPRAITQDEMNLCFEGEDLDIAERYTNTAKIMFLALWYSAMYPASFFLCTFAMIINYFLDRFSLMRTWKRRAAIGEKISVFNQKYFFAISNVVMAVFSAFYWSAFPYDNLCETGQTVGDINPVYSQPMSISPDIPVPLLTRLGLVGDIDTFEKENTFDVTLDNTVPVYTYCNQDFFSPGYGIPFPFTPSLQEGRGGEWMTPTQEQITTVFGWSSFAIVLAVVLRIIYNRTQDFWEMSYGVYKPIGEVQGVRFSMIKQPTAYIPQVRSKKFSYPLLVCDSKTVDEKLYGWKDATHKYAYHDLTIDAELLLGEGSNFSKEKCFSRVKRWGWAPRRL